MQIYNVMSAISACYNYSLINVVDADMSTWAHVKPKLTH